jgi:hypothetical protein
LKQKLTFEEVRLKKISWPLCLLFVLCCCRWPGAARADSPVTPFVDSQTNAVIYVNLSALDMDQIDTWRQKASDASNADPEQKARADAQAKVQIAKAKQWLSDFKTAGGQDMYIVVSLGGMMMGQPGALIIPVGGGADPDALAKVFNPGGNPPPADTNNPGAAQMMRMRPQTAVIGNAVVFSTGAEVEKLKTPSSQPRQDLTDALAAGGDAAVRVAFSPSSLKSNPMIGMMMMGMNRGAGGAPGGPPQVPFSEPQWDAVSWVSVSFSPPPKESGSFICQCKDADSANALLAMFNKEIQDKKNDPNNNTSGLSQDDIDKLTAAVKPQVSGSQVVVSIDQDTMDNVIGPIMAKSMQKNMQHQAGPGPGAMPPDNGGMNGGGMNGGM